MGAFKCDSCIHKVVCQATVDGPCIEDCAMYTKESDKPSTNNAMLKLPTWEEVSKNLHDSDWGWIDRQSWWNGAKSMYMRMCRQLSKETV